MGFNAYAQNNPNSDALLYSQFTSEVIKIDGEVDPAWEGAKPYLIEKAAAFLLISLLA